MSVVEDMGRHIDDEPDPTREEAIAAFEAATPARLVRPPRRLTVVYRYADGIFTATSPDLTDLEVTGRSMYETRKLVHQDLDDFLDPAVEVIEIAPRPEPQIGTSAASCSSFVLNSPREIVSVTSSGAGRAFVSPGRGSTLLVRA
jgi:hypothetical protein